MVEEFEPKHCPFIPRVWTCCASVLMVKKHTAIEWMMTIFRNSIWKNQSRSTT